MGAHAEGEPGRDDEEHDLEPDERQDAEVLAQQQLPARDRLGEQDRRRARFQERRDEPRGPDQGQQQSERAGDAPAQDQFEEPDRVAPLAAERERNGAKGQGHAAADRLDSLAPGLLGTDHERRPVLLGSPRPRVSPRGATEAAGRAPARRRPGATRLPRRSRSGRAARRAP